MRPGGDVIAEGLRTLWTHGLRSLLHFSARGRVVSFIPVGLISLLPLHAAGEPGPADDQHSEWRHAGGFAAVRYAPNARALGACRRNVLTAGAGGQSLLAVDAAVGAGAQPALRLRHVGRETEEVVRRWSGPEATTVHNCTWTEFQVMAGRHTVWHLACHAAANPNSIMESRLLFTDRAVGLEELRRTLPPGPRRLAVLSACQTNVTGAAMPNEMVGLPSAFIELGFAGVIASAWRVDDLATTYLMTAFYHGWCQDGDEPVVALNRAQRWLGAATRAELVATLPGIEPEGDRDSAHPYADARYWAPFAYTGV
jgi:CHAT domain-containing protein